MVRTELKLYRPVAIPYPIGKQHMPSQEYGRMDQTAAEKIDANLQRAVRRKLQAEDGAAAMGEYLADEIHRRRNIEKLRSERLAREATIAVPALLAKAR